MSTQNKAKMPSAAADKTAWKKYECGAGKRWTSASRWDDNDGEICSFSGCGCGTKVKTVGITQDREEAAKWFRS